MSSTNDPFYTPNPECAVPNHAHGQRVSRLGWMIRIAMCLMCLLLVSRWAAAEVTTGTATTGSAVSWGWSIDWLPAFA